MSWAWKAEFSAHYLEEVTRKTGKPMSYEQFINTLNHSLSATDASAFVDLLNNHDLQLLKGQKTGNRPQHDESQDGGQPQKKYLIMTRLDKESR